MAEKKTPVEEMSAFDAEAMFANAAKAMGGKQGRSEGFRRVSIPVSEPVRPELLPKEEAPAETVVIAPVEAPTASATSEPEGLGGPAKAQSRRKAWYLRRQKEEELEEEESVSTGYDFGGTTVIPSAVTFDYGDEYEGEDIEFDDDEEYEYTEADVEEEAAFSALEQALSRHADVYGDPRKNRRARYHDYGFGMGISFDGPSYFDDEDDDI